MAKLIKTDKGLRFFYALIMFLLGFIVFMSIDLLIHRGNHNATENSSSTGRLDQGPNRDIQQVIINGIPTREICSDPNDDEWPDYSVYAGRVVRHL